MQCGLFENECDAVMQLKRWQQSVALPFIYEGSYANSDYSTVLLDKRKVNFRITNALPETVHIVSKANPSQLMKSIKNEIELENTSKAHLLDGIAVTKFMYW